MISTELRTVLLEHLARNAAAPRFDAEAPCARLSWGGLDALFVASLPNARTAMLFSKLREGRMHGDDLSGPWTILHSESGGTALCAFADLGELDGPTFDGWVGDFAAAHARMSPIQFHEEQKGKAWTR